MKKIIMFGKVKISNVFTVCAMAILFSPTAFVQSNPQGDNGERISALDTQKTAYRMQMMDLMKKLKNTKTVEERKAVRVQMKQTREQYQTSHPIKELTVAEKDAQHQKTEETYKTNPFQWQMYQLRQSMVNAKTQDDQETIRAKIQNLRAQYKAEKEAKLTPEQKGIRQARQEKNTQMQTELKTYRIQMRAAKNEDERKTIRAQIKEILKKYH